MVLMLGTNGLKCTDAYGAARGIECLVKYILDANHIYAGSSPVFEQAPKVLLIAPPHIHPDIGRGALGPVLRGGYEQSLLFAQAYEKAAQTHHTAFLDASQYAHPSSANCGPH